MAKSHYIYRDTYSSTNDQTKVTEVKGVTSLREPTHERLVKAINDVQDAFELVVREELVYTNYGIDLVNKVEYETVAHSKCNPEDSYDERKGYIIAERKAEIKGIKKALYDVTYLRKKIDVLSDLVRDMEDNLDQKMVKFEVDLAVIRNK